MAGRLTSWISRTTAAPPDPAEFIARLVGPSGRIVVFDCETTGIYTKDRVIEVALVTVGPDGEVLDQWESLVNPRRDVGPTWIHGITGSVVAGAPEFEELAGAIAMRLDGAVLAAHNLPFDLRMISAEFARSGVAFDPGAGVDTLRLARGKLGDVCRQYGIMIGEAHRALDDALATAQLLLRIAGRATEPVAPARFPSIPPVSERTVVRDVARGSIVVTTTVPAVLRAAGRLPLPPDEAPGALSYLELLERVLEDLRIDAEEAEELGLLAHAAGLDEAGRRRLHDRYLAGLLDEVLADGEVTAAEYDQLVRIAAALGADQDVVDRRTRSGRSGTATLTLVEGMRFCITGDIPGSSKEELAARLRRAGFTVEDSVTKRTDLLIAADPTSQSGKAEKARRYGIPIVPAAAMAHLRPGEQVVTSVLDVERLIAHSCVGCGRTWTSSARSARRIDRCDECRGDTAPPKPPAVPEPPHASAPHPPTGRPAKVAGAPEVSKETLVCEECGSSWERQISRGRKPKVCPGCRV
jgi:DNA polymerase III subunit epsilon